jgi:hypothetical protein
MADCLKKTYERLFDDGSGEMKICRGKVHDYLGMTLDFTVPGEVKITSMIQTGYFYSCGIPHYPR